MVGDIVEKVKDSRNLLEKLGSKIPLWKDFQERQEHRSADQILRKTLVTQLSEQRKRLDVAQMDLISSGKLDLVDDIGSAVTQLQTFTDRVRLASYGYSGLFDAVKINQDELEKLYGFDAALFDYVDRLNAANDRLQEAIGSGEGAAEVIRIIKGICREANSTFDDREHVILGSE